VFTRGCLGSFGQVDYELLEQFEIERFRSCHDLTISGLSDVTVFIGRNGAGKSNIISALLWVASQSRESEGAPASLLQTARVSISVTLKIRDQTFRYRVSNQNEEGKTGLVLPMQPRSETVEILDPASPVGWRNLVTRRGESVHLTKSNSTITLPESTSSLVAIKALRPADEAFNYLEALTDYLSQIVLIAPEEIAPSQLAGVIQESEYKGWIEKPKGTRRDLDILHFKIVHMHLTKPEVLREVEALMGQNGLGLIDKISVDVVNLPGTPGEEQTTPGQKFYFVRFVLCNRSSLSGQFYLGDLSFGTRRILRLLVTLLADEPSLMIIEQPEDGLHYGLLHKLVPILDAYTDKTQFFLTSHSSQILNRLQPEQVQLVDMINGVTSVRKLTHEEVVAAQEFMGEDGPLADYLETLQEN
jgi:predicted ATPase